MMTTKYYESPDAWFESEGIDNYTHTGQFAYIHLRRVEYYRYKSKDSWFINDVLFVQEIEGWRLASEIELNALLNSGEVI